MGEEMLHHIFDSDAELLLPRYYDAMGSPERVSVLIIRREGHNSNENVALEDDPTSHEIRNLHLIDVPQQNQSSQG